MSRAEQIHESVQASLDHRSVKNTKTRKQLWIYFAAVNRESVKIGKTRGDDPRKRLEQHAAPSVSGHRDKLELLAAVKSNADADETAILNYFQVFSRMHSAEVFRPAPELIEYVRWLRDLDFVADAEDGPEVCAHLSIAESSTWMPEPERRKTGRRVQRTLDMGTGSPFGLEPRTVTGDDFYTHEDIIAAARATFGGCIDLDPATHARANGVVRAARVYTFQTNGLEHPWSGSVWLNPPFSDWATWAAKVLVELRRGEVKQLCALAATRTLTAQYFTPLREACDAICIFDGRIPFRGPRATTSPDDGHAVLYFGERVGEFRVAFAALGTVFRNLKVVA